MHLEVAIKFYLGLPNGPGAEDDPARWIGPSGIDSLALKCHHMQTRQLPLSASPAARRALALPGAAAAGSRPAPWAQLITRLSRWISSWAST